MKKTGKVKTIQAPKGNLKISNFFKKQTSNNLVNKPECSKSRNTCGNGQSDKSVGHDINTIPIDSDSEDFELKPKTKLECKKCDVKRFSKSTVVKDPGNNASAKSNQHLTVDNLTDDHNGCHQSLKKRKLQSPEKNCKLKKSSFLEVQLNSCEVQNNIQGSITVKTPEKLFSKSFLDKQNNAQKEATLSSPAKISNKMNPESSKTPLKNCDINISMTNNVVKKTPPKMPKSSPRVKLFHKSPRKLEEFNVQIIDNFVRITPSKSNKERNDLESPRRSGSKQASILAYISPSPSEIAIEAQKVNETTPQKENSTKIIHTPNHSKAKTKLDFSDDTLVESLAQTVVSDVKEKGNICLNPSLNDLHIEFDDDWDENFNAPHDELNLNLEQSRHCKVLESIESRTRVTIKVQSTSSEEKAVCYLEGFWINTVLKVGNIIHLHASRHSDGNWFINNDVGLLVFEPDLLISTTSVVGSLFCKRHSVLSERYPGFEPANRIMIIGVFVHMLLQNVLKNNIKTTSQIEDNIQNLISSDYAMRRMYESSLSTDDVRKELLNFVPKIMNFIRQYTEKGNLQIAPQSSNKNTPKPWSGKIDSIDDIEENIWCPELGVKGKVDLSIYSENKILPLELKTGRASMSLEHKGQVMLYVMMMNKLGHEISSGLLLYLKEELLTEVNLNPHERRDIIILRNELAYYLSKRPTREQCEDGSQIEFLISDLPEPIDHPKACRNCPYNVVCSSLIKYENHDLSSKQNFAAMQEEVTKHLEKRHLDYFIHWSFLLLLENVSQKDTKSLREIYTVATEERVRKGRCINDLSLVKTESKSDSAVAHTFEKGSEKSLVNFLGSGIMENSYVVISIEHRPAVATGFVTYIDTNSVTVSVDKDLTKKFAGALFNLDTYDSLSTSSFNMASLTLLLEDSARSDHLRKIIINKEEPSFLSKLPKIVATKSLPILKRLNKIQQRAVLKSVSAKDFLLIKGMPGTGKTATIVALVQLLVETSKSVLITSHTHSAVDNVCIRLQKFGVDVLRLGSISRVNEKLKLSSEYNLTKDCKTPEEMEEIYNKAQVIAVTCLGSGHPLLSKRTFDVCIVDESTQVVQPSVIRPLYCAKTFILIGDPDQLPPIIKSKEAIRRGMSESLFERLNNEESCVALNQNYRMNKSITALANALTYKGDLLIGNEAVANATLPLPNENHLKSKYVNDLWILGSLANSLDCAVQIIDTNLNDEIISAKLDSGMDPNPCINIFEAAVLIKLVNTLIESGVCSENIGVIATYSAQVAFLSKHLGSVDVSTVDRFQGKDKSVILYSCTKYKSSQPVSNEFQILEDQRRLTVAITRAKHKLIIVGDLKVVGQYTPFLKMLGSLDEKKFIRLEEGKLGFSWDSLLAEYYPDFSS